MKWRDNHFTKAVASYGYNTLRYNYRQDFVSDVCKAVQSLLKEWNDRSKENGRPVKEFLFHYTFEIYMYDKDNSVNYLAEEWDIQLDLGSVITVQKCVQRDFEHRTKVFYFGEELKSSRDDYDYNKVRGIKEFRAFLNQECLGIGMADQPRERLSKDSLIFNLMMTLIEDSLTEWDGIKDPKFREHVCYETGMSKEYFNEIVQEFWGN